MLVISSAKKGLIILLHLTIFFILYHLDCFVSGSDSEDCLSDNIVSWFCMQISTKRFIFLVSTHPELM